jgi:hypothetical protein
METLIKKLDELNSLIKGTNSDVMKMINVSAETELLIRSKTAEKEKLMTAENKIEEILKNHL